MFHWTRALVWVLGISTCLALAGCGGNSDLATVEGQVTLDGRPLPDAFVVFSPTSGGTTSYGRTDADGHYEMMFTDDEKGAWLGENLVRISTGDVSAETGGGGAKEQVPAVYNQQTTLKVDVEKQPNTFDFDLQSDAGVIADAPAE